MDKSINVREWVQELRGLKASIKQRQLSRREAIKSADRLLEQYSKRGAQPVTDVLNAHLQLHETKKQMEQTIQRYQEQHNTPVNTTTYNVLLSKSNSLEDALLLLDEMTVLGFYPNTYTLNGLIKLSPSVNEGQLILRNLSSYDVSPNIQTYNTLLSKANTEIEKEKILEEMSARNISRNLVTYNTLIGKAPDYTSAASLFMELKTRKLRPQINTMVTLLKKVNSRADLQHLLRLQEEENIQPNHAWHTNLRKAEDRL
ncbi:MAG: hypothetical protein ACE362_20000 [Phaeodactylibacter xiamenensis]|uniref:Uncharacterized protein n=1 Tax=Phaeodactylibacter xiamenensis TaxID=1524460 RepID=A0A098S2A0_9BACT|nr:hypothetical protein [Phaeodactylibacter xiamenensis]KGE85903.1 hypothetical protein IX84_25180 [Phaeodactylibacter xiamenensis]MCR9051255.1 hypothetical protein [bacterium]